MNQHKDNTIKTQLTQWHLRFYLITKTNWSMIAWKARVMISFQIVIRANWEIMSGENKLILQWCLSCSQLVTCSSWLNFVQTAKYKISQIYRYFGFILSKPNHTACYKTVNWFAKLIELGSEYKERIWCFYSILLI